MKRRQYGDMKRYTVTPRGKKYVVEEINANGSRRVVISFPTEDAAVSCARELQRQSESREDRR